MLLPRTHTIWQGGITLLATQSASLHPYSQGLGRCDGGGEHFRLCSNLRWLYCCLQNEQTIDAARHFFISVCSSHLKADEQFAEILWDFLMAGFKQQQPTHLSVLEQDTRFLWVRASFLFVDKLRENKKSTKNLCSGCLLRMTVIQSMHDSIFSITAHTDPG